MACIGGPDPKDNLPTPSEIRDAIRCKNRASQYEAAFCALYQEVAILPNGQEIILKASKNGRINLDGLAALHELRDITRLKEEMQKYSQHEKMVIAALLKVELE